MTYAPLFYVSKQVITGFHSVKQKFSFQVGIDFHHGLRAATNTNSIEYTPGPTLHRNLVTKEILDQLVSHILANNIEGWRFLKAFVKNIDAYITELENINKDVRLQ